VAEVGAEEWSKCGVSDRGQRVVDSQVALRRVRIGVGKKFAEKGGPGGEQVRAGRVSKAAGVKPVGVCGQKAEQVSIAQPERSRKRCNRPERPRSRRFVKRIHAGNGLNSKTFEFLPRAA